MKKVVIRYPFSWGGQIKDKKFWEAQIDGEIWDYDSKENLIEKAIKEGFSWEVLRYHRNGKISIVNKG